MASPVKQLEEEETLGREVTLTDLLPAALPADPLLPRATLSPTHFTSLHLDGLSLDGAVQEYLDWIEGVRSYARRRPTRQSEGVPAGFDRCTLLRGESPSLTNGCELTARSKPDQVLLRFVHRDTKAPEIWWHSVVRLTTGGDPAQGVRVEHATGRALPPIFGFHRLPERLRSLRSCVVFLE
jgi:hypothetical protein